MDTLLRTLIGNQLPARRFTITDITDVQIDQSASLDPQFMLTLDRHFSSEEEFENIITIIKDKKVLQGLDLGLMDRIDAPRGLDSVKFKWYWAILLKSYCVWVSLSNFLDIEVVDFNLWAHRTFGRYADSEGIDLIHERLGNELFTGWLHTLRNKVVESGVETTGIIRGRQTADVNSSGSNEDGAPPRRKRKSITFGSQLRRASGSHRRGQGENAECIDEIPLFPSNMPDVWSYSKKYFSLQESVRKNILSYLIFLGYDNAVKEFIKEYASDPTLSLDENEPMDGAATEFSELQLGEVFAEWENEDYDCEPAEQILSLEDVDLEEVTNRKNIRDLILDGKVNDAIVLIEEKYPWVFVRFPAVKFRLYHLQLVENIKSHIEETPAPTYEEHNRFLHSTMEFVEKYMTNREISQDPEMVSAMEECMALLSVCSPGEEIPASFEGLLSPQRRLKVAKATNDAVYAHNFGTTGLSVAGVSKLLSWSFGKNSKSFSQTANVMLRK